MKQLVEFLAKALVDHPEEVKITERNSDDGLVLELKVANDDLGRIIGRQGQTVKAIRQLITVAATQAKTKVSLVIQEE